MGGTKEKAGGSGFYFATANSASNSLRWTSRRQPYSHHAQFRGQLGDQFKHERRWV
jgi:hypothetical protein